MTEISTPIQAIKTIRDDRFDTEHIGNYELILQPGHGFFRFAVFDTDTNRCLCLEDYALPHAGNQEVQKKELADIFFSHIYLRAGYWKKIRLVISANKFTLIPASLYDAAFDRDYLALNVRLTGWQESVHTYHMQMSDACHVFACYRWLADWLQSIYPAKTIQLIHRTAALADGFIRNSGVLSDHVLLHIENQEMVLIVTGKQKLRLCNVFHVPTYKDVLYYVLFALEELGLSQTQACVLLSGEAVKGAELWNLLAQYITHISLTTAPQGVSLGYVFDDVPENRYTDLISAYLCAD